jgi:hypothetical protein
MATRALRDLGLDRADVVLGGGMLCNSRFLVEQVAARLPSGARPVVASDPPVLGATLAALDGAGAPPEAHARLRAAFGEGLVPEHA